MDEGNQASVRQRYVFLHYHVFAGCGTTIDWALERNLPGAYHVLSEPAPWGVVSNEEVIAFLTHHPAVRALSSHHFQPPFPSDTTWRFIEICFLRHPLDRLQSIYSYYRRLGGALSTQAVKAQALDLRAWLDWFIQAEPFNAFSQQTAFWGREGPWAFPPSRTYLDRATARLQHATLLGVMERFDESLVAAEHYLRPIFPRLDLSYAAHSEADHNGAERSPDSLDKRLERMRDQCGSAFFEQLRGFNELDEELWRWATQELDRRLSYVPDVAGRLAAFQTRCAELRADHGANHDADRAVSAALTGVQGP